MFILIILTQVTSIQVFVFTSGPHVTFGTPKTKRTHIILVFINQESHQTSRIEQSGNKCRDN